MIEEIVNKSTEERFKIRKEKSSKLADGFHAWVEENQKQGLMRYLEDGNIEMSNNIAERPMRPFTVGRKNGYSVEV